MQVTPLYLYKQITDVQIFDGFHKTRNKIVYAADLILHKDVMNVLHFQFKNADQKRTPIGNKEFIFVALDDGIDHNHVLFEVPLNILSATTGAAEAIIPEQLLYGIEPGRYEYAIKYIDADGAVKQAYVNDNYGARGELRIELASDPRLIDSAILHFDPVTNLTDVVGNNSSLHTTNTIHTVVIKFKEGTPFDGNVIVQATLDSITDQFTQANFIDIATIPIVGGTTPIVYNFHGAYTGIRFLQGVTNGEILEVQYRH